jgi:hypothetical protein
MPKPRVALLLALSLALGGCATKIPDAAATTPDPRFAPWIERPTVFNSLGEMRRYNSRLTKQIPEEPISKALRELNLLTWTPPGEPGMPYSLPLRALKNSDPPSQVFTAFMKAEGVDFRAVIQITKNITLDHCPGKLEAVGKAGHRILAVDLIEYDSKLGIKTCWP